MGPRGISSVVVVSWLVLGAAGVAYASRTGVPAWAAGFLLAAFLIEGPLYLLAGMETGRAAFARLPRDVQPWVLGLSALAPYLIYSIPCGVYQWPHFGTLAGLIGLMAFWYCVAPRHALFDVLFLALFGMLMLSSTFKTIYAAPAGAPRVDILGKLMWVRLAVLAVVVGRGFPVAFGFLPSAAQWKIGARQFLLFLPVGAAVGFGLGIFQLDKAMPWAPQTALTALGAFLGTLLVVAYFEEFIFRGVLQQWLGEWMGRPILGLILTSAIFGASHLPFRFFPNWKFALLAAIAGLFYGRAYREARDTRAAMAAHALVVTVWTVALGKA
ncbi:MAG: CPBP family intramembrane metalloprotease [Acidobacteria bacterium]|nr:CPBP family intramembrane metalloprotease [Acidobacteriota bacterium]